MTTRKRQGKTRTSNFPPAPHPDLPTCQLPHSCAAHKWEPLGLFLTAAFTPPTLVPGPSGMPTLPHMPTTALPCLLSHLAPGPDIQHEPGAHPEHTYMHHRGIHLLGEAPDSELPLALSPQTYPVDSFISSLLHWTPWEGSTQGLPLWLFATSFSG